MKYFSEKMKHQTINEPHIILRQKRIEAARMEWENIVLSDGYLSDRRKRKTWSFII